MKVIDLLNKIANGEEVPTKIKYDGIIWKFEEDKLYYSDNLWLDDYCNLTQCLNDEIEILEEEKKIPEKWNDKSFTAMRKEEDSIDYDIQKLKGYIETIMRTQNHVIDYLKNKGDE